MCSDALHTERWWWLEGWGPGVSPDRGAGRRGGTSWERAGTSVQGPVSVVCAVLCGRIYVRVRTKVRVHLHVLTDASIP